MSDEGDEVPLGKPLGPARVPRNERVDHFGFPSRFRGLGR
jgi:hypothetical protein